MLTTMSWLNERPRPVPSPAGFVVKKGLNIFPSPRAECWCAVADPDSTLSPRFGCGGEGGLITIAIVLGPTLRRRVKAVGNQIQKHPGDFLGKHVDLTMFDCGPLQGDIEALFSARAP